VPLPLISRENVVHSRFLLSAIYKTCTSIRRELYKNEANVVLFSTSQTGSVEPIFIQTQRGCEEDFLGSLLGLLVGLSKSNPESRKGVDAFLIFPLNPFVDLADPITLLFSGTFTASFAAPLALLASPPL
jgi:hypothetical protein